MNISVGIIGLPNVGKSTLFNVLLKRQVADVSNYPFCTIEPNVGIVEVPDERLEKLSNLIFDQRTSLTPYKVVPAIIKFVDIAGLVKNAHQGEGLGNQFLHHIREADFVLHVLRVFDDQNISHYYNRIDPFDDLNIVNTELALTDLETVQKRLTKIEQEVRSIKNDKQVLSEVQLLQKLESQFSQGRPAVSLEFSDEEQKIIDSLHLLTMKKVIYVLNLSENQKANVKSQMSEIGSRISELTKSTVIFIYAKLESELADLSAAEQKEYLSSLGLEKSALERLIQLCYQELGLITFFSWNEKELHAWTIKKNTKAPQAGGVIHSDFEKNFIRAEVINYDDLIKMGSMEEAKKKGMIKIQGKDYEIKDGDCVWFKVGSRK